MRMLRVPMESTLPSEERKLQLPIRVWLRKVLLVILGGVLASIGLELFLIPNQIITLGMTGVSAIFAYWTEMRLGLFLFLFNLPFLFLSYKHIRREFVLVTVLGLFVLSISTIVLHPVPALIEDRLTAAVCGGLTLGLGIGLVVRYGGTLDTFEMADHSLLKFRSRLSPDIVILIVNCIVLIGAGLIFGWDQAMYTIIAYLIAYEMVRLSIRGYSPYREVRIMSNYASVIEKAVQVRLQLQVMHMEWNNTSIPDTYSESSMERNGSPYVLVYRVHILDTSKLKAMINDMDPGASVQVDRNLEK